MLPDGLYIISDGKIYFEAQALIAGISSAGLIASKAGLLNEDQLSGFTAAVNPMYEVWLKACKEAGIDVQ